MAITKVQQSALLTQLWTPDDAWQSPGNVTLSGVSAGNLVLTFGAWWDTGGGGGGAQQIPTDSNGTLAAGISPAFPSASPPNWPVSGQILRILSAAAGNHVITPPVLGADGDGLFFAAEFSGGAAGTWTQVEANSNVVLSATPGAVDGVSVSTAGAAQVGDLVVALCTTDGDPSAIGVGAPSGYANEILLTTTTTVNIAAGAGWMIATSAGAQTASWAWADTACQLGQACIAVFRFTPSGPTITGQPSDQTVNNGATATFSVTATGTAPITYQWQDNSSGSFADIGGATSSSYAPTASYAMQGRQYRCLVSDAGGGPVTSSAATLRVAFNLSGTGPRAYPRLGAPFGAGSVESWLRGSASGGGTSLTPTNAAITVTGFAPTISQPHVANPGVGALTLASFAPTVAQGTNLAPSVGALALATYAPSIAQPQSVSPAVGALTLATYVPSVVQNTILTPAQIGLAITSFAPVVVQNTNVDPATIALSLSGPAPTVTQATLLTPASAALVLAGPSPTVSQAAASSITPDVVALSLATFAPTISQPIASNPLPGSLTLSTYAPSVSQALNVVPDVGSLSLSTFAPSIAQPVDVVPSVAALALGTFAPSVSQDFNVTPASSALVLNGYAPSVTQVPPGSQSVTPDVGSLTVVTYEPIVSRLGGGGYDDDKPKRKHRWLVQIGKKTYEVGSMREAQALLDRKEEEATQQAEKVVQKKAPKSRARIVKAPEPVAQAKRSSTDTAMQTQEILRRIQEYNATIDAIVRLAQEQDDEEALLMLL